MEDERDQIAIVEAIRKRNTRFIMILHNIEEGTRTVALARKLKKNTPHAPKTLQESDPISNRVDMMVVGVAIAIDAAPICCCCVC